VTFFEAEAELLAFCSTPFKTKLKPNHSNPHTKHHERFAPKNKMPPPQPKPSLVESFEKLQLDPRFHGHQAEFDVVCWQHIHQHLPADSDWISKLRQDSIHLGDQTRTKPNDPSALSGAKSWMTLLTTS
jgi:hypothetical protein